MKKIYTFLMMIALCAVSIGSYAADVSQTAKVDSVLTDISTASGLVEQTLDVAHVDFGGATELKDSVFIALGTLSTDTNVAKIKERWAELAELGEQAKKYNELSVIEKVQTAQGITNALFGLLLLLVGYLISHFGKFFGKKKDS